MSRVTAGCTPTIQSMARSRSTTVRTPPPFRSRPGSTFSSGSGYGYVIGYDETAGGYTVNGQPDVPLLGAHHGRSPATHALMTAPQMFTLGGNFYTFDQDLTGAYVSVTGNQQTYPINPYQFSLNGTIYIINTNVQPNTVIGGGNIYPMTAGNTQFVINGVQYTITLKGGSLNGATISGQFNITQGNVVVIENYVYEIDTLNGQLVGNGTAYPLTTSGVTYTITTADRSFTVTTEPNATTRHHRQHRLPDQQHHGRRRRRRLPDPRVPHVRRRRPHVQHRPRRHRLYSARRSRSPARRPITQVDIYRRRHDLHGERHRRVRWNELLPDDRYAGAVQRRRRMYTLRNDGVSIADGRRKTYIGPTAGPLSPNQFTFGTETIFFGRPADLAAFDGQHYYAIANGQFTDTNTGLTFTLSGNTAVHEGNSYEIFSNLGAGPYFEVPGGPMYYVNIPVADTGIASGDIFHVFPVTSGGFTIPLSYTITVAAGVATIDAFTFTGGPTVVSTLTAVGNALTGGYFVDPVTKITYTCVVDGTQVTFVDSSNVVYPFPAPAPERADRHCRRHHGGDRRRRRPGDARRLSGAQQSVRCRRHDLHRQCADRVRECRPARTTRWSTVASSCRTPTRFDVAYTVSGGSVIKGYVISADDEFSVDGNVVYTVNAVNVVRATNQATSLAPSRIRRSRPAGFLCARHRRPTKRAFNRPASRTTPDRSSSRGDDQRHAGHLHRRRHDGDRRPQTAEHVRRHRLGRSSRSPIRRRGVTFTFDSSGNNPVTAAFSYTNHFFVDAIAASPTTSTRRTIASRRSPTFPRRRSTRSRRAMARPISSTTTTSASNSR